MLSGLHRHHIIPRYLGGSNHPDNLVLLEPIDHAIAHLVRYKIYKNPADAWAHNRLVASFDEMGVPTIHGFDRPYLKGVPKSEEHRKKISAAHIGRPKNPTSVEKTRAALKGRKATERQIENLSLGRLCNNTDEARKKRSDSLKGRDTSAWSHKTATALRGRKASDEVKARLLAATKGRKQTPEQIAKRVASRKATLAAQGRTV